MLPHRYTATTRFLISFHFPPFSSSVSNRVEKSALMLLWVLLSRLWNEKEKRTQMIYPNHRNQPKSNQNKDALSVLLTEDKTHH